MSPCTVGKVYARRMIPKMRYCGAEVLLNDMRVVFESFAMWLVVSVKGEFLDEAAKTYKQLKKIDGEIATKIDQINRLITPRTKNENADSELINFVIKIHKEFYTMFDRFTRMKFEKNAVVDVLEMLVFRFQPNKGTDLNDFISLNHKHIKRRDIRNIIRKAKKIRTITTQYQMKDIEYRVLHARMIHGSFKNFSDSRKTRESKNQDPILNSIIDKLAEYIINQAMN